MLKTLQIFVTIAFILIVAGCGDSISRQLSTDFQRMVVAGNYDSVADLSSVILQSRYGKVSPGKIKGFFYAGPVSYTDQLTARAGQEYCSLQIIDRGKYVEVYVQVTRRVLANRLADSLNQAYGSDGYSLETPMHTGESLPESRRVQWRYNGRDRNRETAILSQIRQEMNSVE